MRIGKWRVFRPKTTIQLFDQTVFEADSIYAKARVIIDETMQRVRGTGKGLDSATARASRGAKLLRERGFEDAPSLMAQLILQSPGAAKAQRSMDRKFGGYLNRQARVFELIDFNDTFVDLVLALEEEYLADFDERIQLEMERFCRKVHAEPFSDKELEAIIHGLSREIAVYLGAKAEGFVARMTSRIQDSMGVDMIVTDPDTKKSIGIDIKTQASFHWRLVRLEEKRAISEAEKDDCETVGFCRIHNSRDGKSSTVLFRIDTRDDHLGEIKNYRFTNTAPLGEKIARALQAQGQYITNPL